MCQGLQGRLPDHRCKRSLEDLILHVFQPRSNALLTWLRDMDTWRTIDDGDDLPWSSTMEFEELPESLYRLADSGHL